MPEKLRLMLNSAEAQERLSTLGSDGLFTRPLKVTVTADDCRDKNRGHPLSCAISMAVRRILSDASYACSRHDGLTVTVSGHYLHFKVNRKASRAIQDFDEGKLKTPITLTFPLEGVSEVAKLTPERKQQINAARQKRAAEGRPDKTYSKRPPLRMRNVKAAKDELRAAIDKAKRDAEAA
ncbi:MAG TPA: hypothetical protein VGG68_15655 [Caulobacteraceae bacterium]|jgi:hypothetical protein